MLKKIAAILLIVIVSLTACQKQGEPNNDISVADENQGNIQFDADAYIETVKTSLIIPENYIAPVYNGKFVAGELPDDELMNTAFATYSNNSSNTWITPALKSKMTEYAGQEVWYKVIIRIDYNKMKYALHYILEYIKELGGYDLRKSYSSEGFSMERDYEALLTAEMINVITASNIGEVMLGQYPRNPEYSAVISDTLAIKLDKMNDTESVEIITVCSADKHSIYAVENGYPQPTKVTANTKYNQQRYVPFKRGTGLTCREFNLEINKYVENIMSRNSILEKRVKIKRDLGIEWREEGIIDDTFLEEVVAGFNAVLTKAEILKLAEDEEIKAIYLAPQE